MTLKLVDGEKTERESLSSEKISIYSEGEKASSHEELACSEIKGPFVSVMKIFIHWEA